MPGITRLLLISVLLPSLSIFTLGLTMTWQAMGLPDSGVIVVVVVALLPLLVAYLPPLREWLGPSYLPVALGTYLVSQTLLNSLLQNLGIVRFDLVQIGPLHFIDPGILLIIPSLLIAWQYGISGAVLAATVTGLLHLATGLLLHFLAPDSSLLSPVAPLLRPDLLYFMPLTIAYLGILQRRQQRQQRQAQAELREYAATAEVLAADRERDRLAGHLQATLARSLAALNEQLEAIGHALRSTPDAAAEQLAQAQEQLRSDYQVTQQVIAELRARPLAEMDLVSAIKQRTNNLSRRGIQVDFESSGEPMGLTDEQEMVLYHVADEVLSHAESHEGVQSVKLNLQCLGPFLALTIHDDGLCQCRSDNGHHALDECSAAAQLIGGQICVDSHEEGGNTIALWVPLGRQSIG